MSQLAEQLKRAADQFTCHSASQSIDQVEAAGGLMKQAAHVVTAAADYAKSHGLRAAAEENYKWAEPGDTGAESALNEAQAQEKGAHWQLMYECQRAEEDAQELSNKKAKPGSLPMKRLVEQMDEANLRMGQLFLLAGMMPEADSLPDRLRQLLEEEDSGAIRQCFPDIPEVYIHALENDPADQWVEQFVSWAFDAGKLGFLIQFERPVRRLLNDGISFSYSWGYYRQYLAYGDSLDEAVAKGLEWAKRAEASEKEKFEAGKAGASSMPSPVQE